MDDHSQTPSPAPSNPALQERLALAVRTNHTSAIAMLAVQGADLNAPAAPGGPCPLAVAARSGGIETATALLDAGAWVDGPPDADATPLAVACGAGRVDMARLLLERGADPNAKRGAERLDPLLRSLGGDIYSAPSRECCELLLLNGADPNGSRYQGSSALLYALFVSDDACCELLLRHGADARARDPKGWSTLAACANVGRPSELILALAAAGADPLAQTPRGTPARIARENEYMDVADLLDALALAAHERQALEASANAPHGRTPAARV